MILAQLVSHFSLQQSTAILLFSNGKSPLEDSSAPESGLASLLGAAQSQTTESKPAILECNNDGVKSEKHAVVFNGTVADAASLACVPQKITNTNLVATDCSMMFNCLVDVHALGVVRGVQSNTRGQGN